MSDLQKQYEDTLSAIGQGKGDDGINQYLSFRIGDEDYAIDILAVREIKGWTKTTALPNQPDYVRGVLNLRGAIVPVFDLRCRFSQGQTEASSKHVVIIVSVAERLIGLLVDQVSDILSVAANAVGPVPDLEAAHTQPYLAGIITVNDTMVVLLSLTSLFENIILPGTEPADRAAA